MSEHEPSWIGVGHKLRTALPRQGLSLAERAELVERIGIAWLDPARLDAIPDEAVEASGYSRAMLRWGLDEACGRWTRAALLGFVDNELKSGSGSRASLKDLPTVVGQVLASTVPPAGFEAIVLMLLGGSSVLVRPARTLAVLTRCFVESIPEVAPELGKSVETLDFDWARKSLRTAFVGELESLVVHGSDETVATWRAAASHHAVPLTSYGHRVSATCVGPEPPEDPDELAKGMALDLAAWDQTGCLSPQALYVHRSHGRDLVSALLDQMPEQVEALQPAPLDTAARALRRNWIRSRAFDAELLESEDGTALLLYDEPRPMEAGPGHRVLQVYPVDSWEQAVASLSRCAPHLQCIALDGWSQAPLDALKAAGLNRVCKPGQMQRPPLDWLHDGIGTLRPLLAKS